MPRPRAIRKRLRPVGAAWGPERTAEMATEDNSNGTVEAGNGQDRAQKFARWNPYAALIGQRAEEELLSNDVLAQLAIAFEVSQLRAEIHFSRKGRS